MLRLINWFSRLIFHLSFSFTWSVKKDFIEEKLTPAQADLVVRNIMSKNCNKVFVIQRRSWVMTDYKNRQSEDVLRTFKLYFALFKRIKYIFPKFSFDFVTNYQRIFFSKESLSVKVCSWTMSSLHLYSFML